MNSFLYFCDCSLLFICSSSSCPSCIAPFISPINFFFSSYSSRLHIALFQSMRRNLSLFSTLSASLTGSVSAAPLLRPPTSSLLPDPAEWTEVLP